MANVPRKWADRLGQVHCQYGTFAKLHTSCPCEVEFQVVMFFLWRRLIGTQNSSLRMFWYRDLNSSHFFPRFGALEHEANRTPDISATSSVRVKSFANASGCLFVWQENERASVFSASYRLNRLNCRWGCSRWRTTPVQFLCKNMSTRVTYSIIFLSLRKKYVRHN